MPIELELQKFPKTVHLKGGFNCELRPMRRNDEEKLHEFFQALPEKERMFIKHRVNDRDVICNWCDSIDYNKNLPILGFADGKVVADATLHQQQGGWKRHIGRVSVLVLPEYRGRGLARALIQEIVEVSRNIGLEHVEAEFMGEQDAAIRMFALMGFSNLLRLEDYVKDIQAIKHDYVLMGLQLKTDEEYAGMG